MNINPHLAHKLTHQRMEESIREADQYRLSKLADSARGKPHWLSLFLKKIKELALNLLRLEGRPSVSSTRRTRPISENKFS